MRCARSCYCLRPLHCAVNTIAYMRVCLVLASRGYRALRSAPSRAVWKPLRGIRSGCPREGARRTVSSPSRCGALRAWQG